MTGTRAVYVKTTGWKRNRRLRFKPYLDLFGQPQLAEDAGKE